MRLNEMPYPSESAEQQCLFRWAAVMRARLPELALLYHVPNEGKRSQATGGRMRAEGLKKGVPDICLPVPRGNCHGLYIELKRQRGGRTSPEQREWIDALNAQGYRACVCCGWEDAAMEIEKYLKGRSE